MQTYQHQNNQINQYQQAPQYYHQQQQHSPQYYQQQPTLPQQQHPIPQQQEQPKRKVIANFSYFTNDQLGQGYQSVVYKGKNNETGQNVAIKAINLAALNEIEQNLIHNEVNSLKNIDNKNVLKLIDVLKTKDTYYIITEFCNQGDLFNLVHTKGVMPEIQAIKLIKHIVNGFKALRESQIIHRDVKSANILLLDGVPKIADFGFSKFDKPNVTTPFYNVGTPIYMCPESLIHNHYSYKSDYWGLGVVFYEALYGCVPWLGENEEILAQNILTIPLTFPEQPEVASVVKDFISNCCRININDRMDLDQMEAHPMFYSIQKPFKQNENFVSPTSYYQNSQQKFNKQPTPQKEVLAASKQYQTVQNIPNHTTSFLDKLSPPKQNNIFTQPQQKINTSLAPDDLIVKTQLSYVDFLFQFFNNLLKYKMDATSMKLIYFSGKQFLIKEKLLRSLFFEENNVFQLSQINKFLTSNEFQKMKQNYLQKMQGYLKIYTLMSKIMNENPLILDQVMSDINFAEIHNSNYEQSIKFNHALTQQLLGSIKSIMEFLVYLEQRGFQDFDFQKKGNQQINLLQWILRFYQIHQLISSNQETSMKSIITICEKNHYEIGLDSLEKLKEELERTGIC